MAIRESDLQAVDAPHQPLTPKPPVIFNWVLRLLIIVGLLFALGAVPQFLPWLPPAFDAFWSWGSLLLAYLIWVMLVERRLPPAELAPRRLHLLLGGLALGAGLFALVFGVLMLTGTYRLTTSTAPVDGVWWAGVHLVAIGAGIGEEVLFRGIVFRLTEQLLGTWAAAVFSALLFGFAHALNPGATLWSSIAIALEAGLLIAFIYVTTRSLWMAIGFHAAWNFVQGPLLGVRVSGNELPSIFRSEASGPGWLTGGDFGVEASVVSVVILVLVAAGFAVLATRRHEIVSPMWVRKARLRRLTTQPHALPQSAEPLPRPGPEGQVGSTQ